MQGWHHEICHKYTFKSLKLLYDTHFQIFVFHNLVEQPHMINYPKLLDL